MVDDYLYIICKVVLDELEFIKVDISLGRATERLLLIKIVILLAIELLVDAHF